MGAQTGAPCFLKQDKIQIYQGDYTTSLVLSPGTTFPFLCFPMNPCVHVIQQVSVKIFPDAF